MSEFEYGCLHFQPFVAGVTKDRETLGLSTLRPRGLSEDARGVCRLPIEFAEYGWTVEEWESYVKYLEWAQYTIGKDVHPTHGTLPACIAKNASVRRSCNGINPKPSTNE